MKKGSLEAFYRSVRACIYAFLAGGLVLIISGNPSGRRCHGDGPELIRKALAIRGGAPPRGGGLSPPPGRGEGA